MLARYLTRAKGTLYEEALQVWLKSARTSNPAQIQNHTAKNECLAIVQGTPSPSEATFHSFLKKYPTSHRLYSDPNLGKEAITRCRGEKSWEDMSSTQ